MHQPPPHYPMRFFALLTLGAIGLAFVAVGITGATGWWLTRSGLPGRRPFEAGVVEGPEHDDVLGIHPDLLPCRGVGQPGQLH
jgi:hypothetical protein